METRFAGVASERGFGARPSQVAGSCNDGQAKKGKTKSSRRETKRGSGRRSTRRRSTLFIWVDCRGSNAPSIRIACAEAGRGSCSGCGSGFHVRDGSMISERAAKVRPILQTACGAIMTFRRAVEWKQGRDHRKSRWVVLGIYILWTYSMRDGVVPCSSLRLCKEQDVKMPTLSSQSTIPGRAAAQAENGSHFGRNRDSRGLVPSTGDGGHALNATRATEPRGDRARKGPCGMTGNRRGANEE